MSVLQPSDASGVIERTQSRQGAAENQLKSQQYGQEVVLDLYDCDPATIRSARKLRAFVDELIALLGMKKFGRTQTPYFGLNSPHTAGYSLLQFIETSSIVGHFSELTNAAYLNIFSCKPFDANAAARFTKKFFGAKRMRKRVIQRQ